MRLSWARTSSCVSELAGSIGFTCCPDKVVTCYRASADAKAGEVPDSACDGRQVYELCSPKQGFLLRDES